MRLGAEGEGGFGALDKWFGCISKEDRLASMTTASLAPQHRQWEFYTEKLNLGSRKRLRVVRLRLTNILRAGGDLLLFYIHIRPS